MDILTLIVITLAISLILNIFLKYLHISPIVGYIFTGIILAIFANSAHIDPEYLAHTAEFGIVFLMFTIGLEFSIQHLKSMKKEVFVFGSLQVILTATLFTFIALKFFGLDIKTAIVVGSALSLSSTAIVLKVLNETGDIHRPYGRNSLGILIFQDLAVIPILLMITILTSTSVSIGDMLLDTLYSAIFVLTTLYVLGKYVLPKFFAFIVDTKTEELFIAGILLIVLGASLFAHSFGFSYSLGAFFAGMLIAETKYKHQIEADLVPFRDLLLGLFFITVGMQVDFNFVVENFFTILILAVSILSLKALLIFAILIVFTFTKRALKTALAIAQVGEFSFAVFAIAVSNNLISSEVHQVMVSVVILSLIFTSLALRYVRPFSNLFYSEPTESIQSPIISSGMRNHVVVCGYSGLGQRVVLKLKEAGLSYVAIEHDRQHVQEGLDKNDAVFFGNAASKTLLESVYIKNASSVIIAINNDEKVRLICEAIKSINKDITVVIKVTHQAQIDDLEDFDVQDYVHQNEIIAHKLVDKATQCCLSKAKS